jgi:hypothetical protein
MCTTRIRTKGAGMRPWGEEGATCGKVVISLSAFALRPPLQMSALGGQHGRRFIFFLERPLSCHP